jgi:transposase-like protein
MRNLQSKMPEDVWPEFKARAAACYQAASPALARLLHDDIAATYGKDLPSAVACLDDDFEACIAHLRFPLGHRPGDPHHQFCSSDCLARPVDAPRCQRRREDASAGRSKTASGWDAKGPHGRAFAGRQTG